MCYNKKRMNRQGGYTIVETSLAIAVSAALVLMMAGIYSMSRTQQFSNAISGAKSFIQSEYNDVHDGINARIGGKQGRFSCEPDSYQYGGVSISAGYAAGNSQCYVMGRLIQFRNDRIQVSYVVVRPVGNTATDETKRWPFQNKSAVENIKEASNRNWIYALDSNGLINVDAGARSFERHYGSGVKLRGAWQAGLNGAKELVRFGDNAGVGNFVIIHSPLGSSVLSYSNVSVSEIAGSAERQIKLNDSPKDINRNKFMVLYLNNAADGGSINSNNASICLPLDGNSADISSRSPAPFDPKNVNVKALMQSCGERE